MPKTRALPDCIKHSPSGNIDGFGHNKLIFSRLYSSRCKYFIRYCKIRYARIKKNKNRKKIKYAVKYY